MLRSGIDMRSNMVIFCLAGSRDPRIGSTGNPTSVMLVRISKIPFVNKWAYP
jgi:hypothetical protein